MALPVRAMFFVDDMNDDAPGHSRSLQWVVWSVLALVIAGVFVLFVREQGDGDVDRRAELPVYSSIPAFSLTNQLAAPVTRDDLFGRVWIADVIFTRCAGPCLKMSREMEVLAGMLPDDAPVGFLSLTTDPEFDTPEILQRYQKRFDLGDGRWTLLTGDMGEFAKLAIDGLKLTAREIPEEERENPDDLFIHSTRFVLVDALLQVRGIYEGMDDSDRQRILNDVRSLLEEQEQ